jgi:hypothetical protein
VEFTYLFLELLVLEHLVRPLEHCPCPTLGFLADWPGFFVLFLLFLVFGYVDLEPGIVDPDLDMIRLGEETLVQRANSVILTLILLEVNVRLPHELGHVERRLVNTEFVERPRPLQIIQPAFKLRILNPGLAVGGIPLDLLLVQGSAPHKLEQLPLEFNIAAEELVLRTHTDGLA